MNSIILLTAARVLRPVLFLFSLFVLFRGHHEPGGGFAGGLLAAAAFSLGAMRRDIREVELQKRKIEPHMLIGTGLLLAMGSGLASMFIGRQFLTGLWAGFFSNVLLFDIGVYLTVMGVVLMTVTTLAEE